MARIRSIKPEFPQSETIGKLSRDARLLFVQLWTIVDDAGRARAASRMLASLLYPYDDDAPTLIEAWLAELEMHGCVRRYEVDGSSFLDLPNWLKHQKIDRPSASKIPAFVEASPHPREHSRAFDADLGSRIMDLGPRISSDADASDARADDAPIPPTGVGMMRRAEIGSDRQAFDQFWHRYPHKVGKQDAAKAFAAAMKRGGVTLEVMLAALDRYIRAKPPDRAWCNPATWLRQGRWEDDPGPDPASQRGPARGPSGASQRISAMAEILAERRECGFPAEDPGGIRPHGEPAPDSGGDVLPFGGPFASGIR